MAKEKDKKRKANKKTPNKNGNAVKKKNENSPQSGKGYEILGVVWIALGLLIGVSIYLIEQSPFGKGLSTLVFGLIGILGYALPLLIVTYGIFIIAKSTVRLTKTAVWICVMLFLALLFINVNWLDVGELSFFNYIGSAFQKSNQNHLLGGFLAAMLAYPMSVFFGKAASNIIIITFFVICLLVVSSFSLKKTFSKLKEGLKRKPKEEYDDDEEYEEEYEEDDSFELEYDDDEEDGNEYSFFENIPEPDFDSYSDDDEEFEEKYASEDEADSDITLIQRPKLVDIDAYSELEEYDKMGVAEADRDIFQPNRKNVEARLSCTSDVAPNLLEYQRPPITQLKFPTVAQSKDNEQPEVKAKKLLSTLASFRIHNAQITNITVGPTITRFELVPPSGVSVKSILKYADDLALALAAEKLRIEAPIPGKSAIGIEVPNRSVSTVYLREIIESQEFKNSPSPLTFALGKDIAGKNIVADLAKMPHLLIAGRTGSGKSVCLNTIILSLVYKASPDDLRLILIDPKVVEFRSYANLPHLLVKVVTDKKKAASALRWAVSEMENRNRKLASAGARDIRRYNQLQVKPEDRMPRIVIIIDELAELMMSTGKEVEESIVRLAQLGRACGMHLIVATQRPSADIITGEIKANIPARIAFAVTDYVNSKVILDSTGAEQLLGNGDMLFHTNQTPKPIRIQGAFVSDDEVEGVMSFFEKTNIAPNFDTVVDSQITAGVSANATQLCNEFGDDLLIDAARLIIETKRASASYIQQRLRLGYNRAARIMEELEEMGIVSPPDGAKPRKVLWSMEKFEATFGSAEHTGEEA
jgi:S-DNA-T family DNA segregation ATPase FtsK/SpoIIIE